MFREKTVIVVGAGASFDKYGLPLGGSLARKIATDAKFSFAGDIRTSQPKETQNSMERGSLAKV